MSGPDRTHLDTAWEYLELMRMGVFEDDEGEIVYPYAFDDEIRQSGLPRSAALAALGVEEDELKDMNFLYMAACARDALEELRRYEADENRMLAFMCYMDICEFLENDIYELDRDEAAGILGVDLNDLENLHQRFAPMKKTIAGTREALEIILRRESSRPGFDPEMN